jgi:hypothetical protein
MKLVNMATDRILIGTMGVILTLLFIRVGVEMTAVRVVVQLAAFFLLVAYGWRAREVLSQEIGKPVAD